MNERENIGVFAANSHTDHPGKVIRAIYDTFRDKDVDVHFLLGTEVGSFYKVKGEDMESSEFDYQYLSLFDYSQFENFDILIISYGSLNTFQHFSNKYSFLAKFEDIPIIVLEDVTEPKEGANVTIDNYGGMKNCVEHLIKEHGYQNIVFLSGPEDNYDSQERRQAYLDAMIENGIPVSDDMIEYGDYSDDVDAQVAALFAKNEGIEAVACANDDMSRAVYRYCENNGLTVGEDIAVTGFDNVSWAWAAKPGLTTIEQKSIEMGQRAAELALAYLNGETIESEQIGTELILRGSCGCDVGQEGPTKKEELNVQMALKEARATWEQAVAGPLMLRELIQSTDNERAFYTTIAKQMIRQGIKSSFLFLQEEPMVNNKDEQWTMSDTLRVVFRQYGDVFHVYNLEEAPIVEKGQGMIPKRKFRDDGAHRYLSFLIFDGNRQYGVLTAEIEPTEISTFYLNSLQLGIAFHFRELSSQAVEDREKLQEQNARLNYSASSDPLTGLLNRRGVLEQMQREAMINEGKQACLFIGDLDHLKEINDTFGHNEGDFAIKAASELLRRIVGDREPLGRIGGDEFLGMFLIDDKEDPEEAIKKKVADVKLSAELFNSVSGKPYYLGVSVGAYQFTCTTDIVINNLIKEADEQLYIAKKSRRETVRRDVDDAEGQTDFHVDDDVLFGKED